MSSLLRERPELTLLPVDACTLIEQHFSTLAFRQDHSSHLWTRLSKCWQPAGELLITQTSSPYMKRLVGVVDEGREKPRSLLVLKDSERVFITVRKMTMLRGSPWHTPIFRGTGVVDQMSVVTEANNPEYHDCNHLRNSGGA